MRNSPGGWWRKEQEGSSRKHIQPHGLKEEGTESEDCLREQCTSKEQENLVFFWCFRVGAFIFQEASWYTSHLWPCPRASSLTLLSISLFSPESAQLSPTLYPTTPGQLGAGLFPDITNTSQYTARRELGGKIVTWLPGAV